MNKASDRQPRYDAAHTCRVNMNGRAIQMKFTRVKEIATALTEVSMDTGYDYDYLANRFNECVEDGQTAEEAFEFVSGVSYEHDWDDEPEWGVAM